MKEKKRKAVKQNDEIKIRPLGDRVLLEPDEPESEAHKKTASGIYIPGTAEREKGEVGTVLAVGEGKYEDGKLQPMRVRPGDRVIFSKYGYDEVREDDKKYFILREENILAIIK